MNLRIRGCLQAARNCAKVRADEASFRFIAFINLFINVINLFLNNASLMIARLLYDRHSAIARVLHRHELVIGLIDRRDSRDRFSPRRDNQTNSLTSLRPLFAHRGHPFPFSVRLDSAMSRVARRAGELTYARYVRGVTKVVIGEYRAHSAWRPRLNEEVLEPHRASSRHSAAKKYNASCSR